MSQVWVGGGANQEWLHKHQNESKSIVHAGTGLYLDLPSSINSNPSETLVSPNYSNEIVDRKMNNNFEWQAET